MTSNALAVVFANNQNPFLKLAEEAGVGGAYGRFNGKNGNYVLGEHTFEHCVAAFEFMDARMKWLGFDIDDKPHNGPEVKIIDGVPLPEPDKTDDTIRWFKQMVVPIVLESGDRILYSSKADYGSRAILKLMKDYGSKVTKNMDADGRPKVPLVEMTALPKDGMEEEKDASGKVIKRTKFSYFVEQFKLTDWYTMDDVQELVIGRVNADAEEQGEVIEGTVIAEGVEVMTTPKQPGAKKADAPKPEEAPKQPGGFRKRNG